VISNVMTTAHAAPLGPLLPSGQNLRQLAGEKRSAALRWINTPAGGVTLLILSTLAFRLLFAAALGLGIDESYMVAAGRNWQLSYFDHPPLAWWMAWAAAHLVGTDTALAVRLPFVLTFSLTTWLMYSLTARSFGSCAGLWAAALLNASPVLGVTAGTWVLPDGPLMAALLGGAICLQEAVEAEAGRAWRWWAGAGGCAGLAMLSKYSAVLSIAGALAFLLTVPAHRRWLLRPHPYVAGLIAAAIFAPVLVWNANHHWLSFLFQGGRATGARLHPFGPLSTLGGEALFLLPWIWLPLVLCTLAAIRRGVADPHSWLLVCLGLPPIAFFTAVSVWNHVLFHWAAPGYLVLFPLLGQFVGHHRARSRAVRVWLAGTAVFVVCLVVVVSSEVRFNWMPEVLEDFAPGKDPDLDAVDWTSLRRDLTQRGLIGRPNLVVAATRWSDAGKIDYALEGRMRVLCLGNDSREYGLTARLGAFDGDDVLIVAPKMSLAQIKAQFGTEFSSLEQLAPAMIRHAGRPAMLVNLYLGHRFRAERT